MTVNKQLTELVWNHESRYLTNKNTGELVPSDRLEPIWGLFSVAITETDDLERHIRRTALHSGANAYEKIIVTSDLTERGDVIKQYAFQLYRLIDPSNPNRL